jgi:hypothetical protein
MDREQHLVGFADEVRIEPRQPAQFLSRRLGYERIVGARRNRQDHFDDPRHPDRADLPAERCLYHRPFPPLAMLQAIGRPAGDATPIAFHQSIGTAKSFDCNSIPPR